MGDLGKGPAPWLAGGLPRGRTGPGPGWQIRPPAVQLIAADADVLAAEMPFLLDEVPNGPLARLPGDDTVKTGEGLRGRTDLGLRAVAVLMGAGSENDPYVDPGGL